MKLAQRIATLGIVIVGIGTIPPYSYGKPLYSIPLDQMINMDERTTESQIGIQDTWTTAGMLGVYNQDPVLDNGKIRVSFTTGSMFNVQIYKDGQLNKTTYGNGGYRCAVNLSKAVEDTNNLPRGAQQMDADYNNKINSVAMNGCQATMRTNIDFSEDGKGIYVEYYVTNNDTTPTYVSIGTFADVQLGSNDWAPIQRLPNNKGFRMYDSEQNLQMLVDGSGQSEETPIDSYWFGYLGQLYPNIFNNVGIDNVSGVDSGVAYAWNNQSVAAGETKKFVMRMNLGVVNGAPTLTQLITPSQQVYARGENISFKATGTDPENDALQLYYQIDIGRPIPVDAIKNSEGQYPLDVLVDSNLSRGNHRITVFFGDSSGNKSNTESFDFEVVELPREVSYDLNYTGAVNNIPSEEVDYQGLATKPQDPERQGYTFKGWYQETSGQNQWNFASEPVTKNMKLYAKWEINQYDVSYDLNYTGAVNTIPSQEVDYEGLATKPANPKRSGYIFRGWYRDAKCQTPWKFEEDQVTAQTKLYAKWEEESNPVVPVLPELPKADIIVDGVVQQVGIQTTTVKDGIKTVTLVADEKTLQKYIDQAGAQATVVFPIMGQNTGRLQAQLTGQMVADMASKDMILEVRTDNVQYIVPADQINMNKIQEQLGTAVPLKDITLSLQVSTLEGASRQVVENAIESQGAESVAPPVAFDIEASYNGQVIPVTQFNQYLSRMVQIPEGVNPQQITTAVVQNAGGTLRHVPTEIVVRDGVYYAQIHTLTNSVYAVIYNPMSFEDAKGHWAEQEIDNMYSRLVVEGHQEGKFEPNVVITQAEFDKMLDKALGLIPGDSTDTPMIRENAIVMMQKSAEFMGLNTTLTDEQVQGILGNYKDSSSISQYAREAVAYCIQANIIQGRTQDTLDTQRPLTRAEAVVMIENLLQSAKFIN
ncbi:MAG: InlB B-repeat-containing protein [Cellulosilyticaceae bacterium]